MGSDPAEPPRSTPASGPAAGDAGERGAPERFGPLILERTRKEDGRALIEYRSEEPQG